MSRKKRSIKSITYLFATFFGTGYLPLAPGTAASIIALVLFWYLPLGQISWLAVIMIFCIIGIFTSTVVEKENEKDPGIVVIDEVVGQWLTLLFIPKTFFLMLCGFVLFRLMDIFKPYPINISQQLGGGFGIMLDDILAAIYAAIILQIILFLT